jgi:3-phosphoshikimate 1-carboxyvinyltransferase
LGANISYLEAEGMFPVKIEPAALTGNLVSIDGSVSSQFISALMMIGPCINGGLQIEITSEILSLPYIEMTKSVMEYFGAHVKITGNIITIIQGKYKGRDITIEPDWSAASYWYEIVAIQEGARVLLKGLFPESLQGDAKILNMMTSLGVMSTFTDDGVVLLSQDIHDDYFTDDFSGCPDLAPAIAAVCAAKNITADLKGLKNFRLKESDRAAALQRELYRLRVKTDFCGGSKFKIYKGDGMRKTIASLNTYNDHRMAMCFAPLAIPTDTVAIENPEVVNKSYPAFWDDLSAAGFRLTFI